MFKYLHVDSFIAVNIKYLNSFMHLEANLNE